MQRGVLAALALLLLAAFIWADEKPSQDKRSREATPAGTENKACHGTAVEFVDTPVQAAKLAAERKKLVFVLHVSGHFEDPDFT